MLYADNHLLALYKPAGLLVQGDRTGDVCLLDLCKTWIKERYKKPGRVFLAMVHRLDRPVAGVVLFARTSKAASRLAKQFRERSVEKKRYLAVVEGVVREQSGRLVHHILRKDRTSRVCTISPGRQPGGPPALSGYGKLARNEACLALIWRTGRRHQIRIQTIPRGAPSFG